MRHVHFYDASTGVFTGQSFSFNGRESVMLSNVPEGCQFYEGSVDYLSQRVDIETGRLVDYVPPQPGKDHEWNDTARRWLKRTDVAEREQRVAGVLAQIDELELSQLRPAREDMLRPNERDQDGKLPSERLQEIDDKIAALRATLSDEKDTSEP